VAIRLQYPLQQLLAKDVPDRPDPDEYTTSTAAGIGKGKIAYEAALSTNSTLIPLEHHRPEGDAGVR